MRLLYYTHTTNGATSYLARHPLLRSLFVLLAELLIPRKPPSPLHWSRD
jgi:hypothetical protein